ncbi:MAG: hypothetical protein IIA83_05475 [Thaumarchaeota archaeon]|nr:hypothetical protein [Nitrososphaerota archaeon]
MKRTIEIIAIVGFTIAVLGFLGFQPFEEKNIVTFILEYGEVQVQEKSSASCKEDGIIDDRTFCSPTLGFEISRPNNPKWDFDTDLANVKLVRSKELPDKYFLGGIYIGTTNFDHVLVAVFDDAKLKEYPLDKWLNQFEEVAVSRYNAITVNKESSLDKDWGIYEAEFEDIDGLGYGTQIIIIKNEKAYLIQSMGLHPEIMPKDQKEDFHYILNSFKLFS